MMMPPRVFLPIFLLWLSPASAQIPPGDPPADPADAAPDALAPDPPPNETPATETPTNETPRNAADAAPPAPASKFSLDTPIADLIADRRAKAVIDKHLPGMSFDKNLDKFSAMSLRGLQPQSGGRLTDTLMEQVGADLAAID